MTPSGRYTDHKPGFMQPGPDTLPAQPGFVSLRWKLLLPLFVVLTIFAMGLTYLVTRAAAQGTQDTQTAQLLWAAESTLARLDELFAARRGAALRLAGTYGVTDAVRTGNTTALRRLLEPLARLDSLDTVLVFDSAGREVIGLRQLATAGSTENYAISSGGTVENAYFLGLILQQGRAEASGLLIMPDGMWTMFAAVPVVQADQVVGVLAVGTPLEAVLAAIRSSSLSQAAYYIQPGAPLLTTFEDLDDGTMLAAAPELFQQAASAVDEIPLRQINGFAYQAAYRPFVFGSESLGVLGVFVPDVVPYSTGLTRQLLALLTAALSAGGVIGGYVLLARALARMTRITATVEALAQGAFAARTRMAATDEVGALGHSVDIYADRVWEQQEALRTRLRRQRRENARLNAILESIPYGIVVQDLDGRVLLMNDAARQMLGSQRVFRSSRFSELTAVVTDVLGPAIAPGIYSLGKPQRIPLGEHMLSAQAAAVLTISRKRVGTVIVLQDITEQVQQEKAREDLLEQLSQEAGEPLRGLANLPRPAAESAAPLRQFAREVARNVAHLQRMIAEIRDLSDFSPDDLRGGQTPLAVQALVEALAEEWQPAIEAAELSLHIRLPRQEALYVLGDERRLRWALGNLLDNAIRYTLPGGRLGLLARRSEETAEIVVQDTGVGVGPEDLPHLFTRFYRGTPHLPDGRVLHTPGMGQGLYIARRVIEAHGGRLRLESQLGQGTRLICTMPLTAPVTLAVGEAVQPAAGEAALLPRRAGGAGPAG